MLSPRRASQWTSKLAPIKERLSFSCAIQQARSFFPCPHLQIHDQASSAKRAQEVARLRTEMGRKLRDAEGLARARGDQLELAQQERDALLTGVRERVTSEGEDRNCRAAEQVRRRHDIVFSKTERRRSLRCAKRSSKGCVVIILSTLDGGRLDVLAAEKRSNWGSDRAADDC